MLFLLDFDNTVSDNFILRTKFLETLEKSVDKQAAKEFFTQHNSFLDHDTLIEFPNLVIKTFPNKALEIFANLPMNECLHKKVPEVIKHLKTYGKVFIFTEGTIEYQKAKVQNSGIEKLVDNVLVFEHKMPEFERIINNSQEKNLIYIDDNTENLEYAKKVNPSVKTIWVRQGYYKNKFSKNPVNINITVENLEKLLSYEFY